MSKVNDIKNQMRSQKQISPSFVLSEEIGNSEETNEALNVGRKQEKKIERKRVSFDIRTDLHKELKLQSILQEKNIYILIEEAIEMYLEKIKE